jgi:hypothetical protein
MPKSTGPILDQIRLSFSKLLFIISFIEVDGGVGGMVGRASVVNKYGHYSAVYR